MSMVKVKTAELTGAELDLAVALATGWTLTRQQDAQIEKDGMFMLCGEAALEHSRYVFTPSTDWSQGGPLIVTHKVSISDCSDSWIASIISDDDRELYAGLERGGTPLIAICRAVVAAKLGAEVEVPQELVG